MKHGFDSQPTLRRATATHLVVVAVRAAPNVPLGPLERAFVHQVDGRRTIAELGSLLDLTPPEAASLAARLIDLGAVRVRADADAVDDGWEMVSSRTITR